MTTLTTIAIGVLMAVLGHIIHLTKKVVELRASGSDIGLAEYVKDRPYRTALGVMGSSVAMGFMIESGAVSPMGALAVGYMADSGLAMLGGKEQ